MSQASPALVSSPQSLDESTNSQTIEPHPERPAIRVLLMPLHTLHEKAIAKLTWELISRLMVPHSNPFVAFAALSAVSYLS